MRSFCLNILGKPYHVQFTKGLIEGDASGMCAYKDQLIKLCSDLAQQQLTETLLHEIIHAVDGEMNTKMKESQVRYLAIGLFQVLRDNPRLIRMIKTGEEVKTHA